MKKQLILSCLCAALLASCSVFHKHADPLAFYDLKTQRLQSSLDISKQKERLHKRNILISDASAPSWLDNTAIHYRLEFHNSAQLHRYANSRWIASPTVMLTQKMRDQIAKSTGNPVIKNNSKATDQLRYALAWLETVREIYWRKIILAFKWLLRRRMPRVLYRR